MFLHLTIYLLFGVFLGVVSAEDRQLVHSVEVVGSSGMMASRARSLLVTRPGMSIDSLMIKQDMKRLLKGYQEIGYWQASVQFPEVHHHTGRVVFRVDSGELTRIGRVVLEGNPHVSKDSLMSVITAGLGAPLVSARLENDLMEMLALYSNAGYPYCAIDPSVNLLPGQDSVTVKYAFTEGPFVRIDAIRFEGNRVTRKDILLREMRVKEGEPYIQSRIDRGMKHLRKLSFLMEVDDPVLEEEKDGSTTLVVTLREAPSGRLEGGIGYAPDTGEAGLTGLFALEFDNFQGSARSGKVLWGRQGRSTSHLGLSYLEPWVLGSPVSAGIILAMQQRPSYNEHRIDAFAELSLAPGTGLRMGGYYEEVRPDSTGERVVFGSRVRGLEGQVEYDGRDEPFNPRHGVRTSARVSWGSVSSDRTRRDRTEVQGHLDTFLPMGRRWVSALSLHAAAVSQSDDVPLEARLRLGGTKTIRGQREEAFLGTEAVWGNLEWRYILGRRSRVFLFLDAGVVNDPVESGKSRWLTPLGFGGGIRAISGLGTLGLDYGLGKGEGPGQGKIHVRMVNEF